MSRKILITGNKGFIGSHLQKKLSKNNEVVGIDLEAGWDRDKLNNNQNLLDCDLPSGVELVIHLAGKSGVRESIKDPNAYWQNNVEVSKRIFKRYKNVRVLYASSSTAYEPYLNPYAASKYMIELAAQNYFNTLGMRFHTVYSEDCQRKNMFITRLLQNKLEYVTDHYRDFIHVNDVCNAIELLMDSKTTGVVDIGTGESYHIQKFSPHLPLDLNTPHERKISQANTEILSNLGWKPTINLKNFLTSKGFDIKL